MTSVGANKATPELRFDFTNGGHGLESYREQGFTITGFTLGEELRSWIGRQTAPVGCEKVYPALG